MTVASWYQLPPRKPLYAAISQTWDWKMLQPSPWKCANIVGFDCANTTCDNFLWLRLMSVSPKLSNLTNDAWWRGGWPEYIWSEKHSIPVRSELNTFMSELSVRNSIPVMECLTGVYAIDDYRLSQTETAMKLSPASCSSRDAQSSDTSQVSE